MASHSWGDNVFRNFLVWVTEDDSKWVEKHIHAYVNIAGPVLGVAKSMTSLLSGAACYFSCVMTKRTSQPTPKKPQNNRGLQKRA